MKLSDKIIALTFGLIMSLMYFIFVLFLYHELGILNVFPLFAGEDDFSVRRLISFSILIPSFIIVGYFFGKSIRRGKKSLLRNLVGMFLLSLLFGVLVNITKDKLSMLNDRDLANLGVLFYFLTFVLCNFFGYYLSEVIKNNRK